LDSQLLVDTQQERQDYGLMTTDSLHLGSMNRHSPPLTNLVTYDSDFEHIAGLTIWKPMDVV
jgi:predicted nucleic acid-binding protein